MQWQITCPFFFFNFITGNAALSIISWVENKLFFFVVILQALERLSFGGSRISDTVMAQSRILLFWYCTTYLLLEKKKPKYQQLELPNPEQTQQKIQLEQLETDLPPEKEQIKSTRQVESESPPLDMYNLEGL